jgi:hypothetical protein
MATMLIEPWVHNALVWVPLVFLLLVILVAGWQIGLRLHPGVRLAARLVAWVLLLGSLVLAYFKHRH